MVTLVREVGEPLGLDIQLDEDEGAWRIRRILHGAVAERTGQFRVGDTVASLNGQPLADIDDIAGLVPSEQCIVRIGVLRPNTPAAALLAGRGGWG